MASQCLGAAAQALWCEDTEGAVCSCPVPSAPGDLDGEAQGPPPRAVTTKMFNTFPCQVLGV